MRTEIFTILAFLLIGFSSCENSQENKTNEKYYFSKTVNGDFEEVTTRVKNALKDEGFSVITEVDMAETLNNKIEDADMQPYRILGVCNAQYAYATIQQEENIGVFLPCKLIIKQVSDDETEVVFINTENLMQMFENNALNDIAAEVNTKFKNVLEKL